jgi:glutathione S-transferase
MSITFYFNPMSSAARIHLSLEELGVPYEKVLLDLQAGDQKKPDFLKLNPNGNVPTVVIDGQPMFESIAIQIYLGQRYGVERGLWPALHSAEEMQALTWLCWGQVSLAGPLFRYMGNTSPELPAELHNAKQAEAALAETHQMLRILDDRLGERQNLISDKWTLVDGDVACVLHWALWASKIDASAYRHLGAWIERATQRPAWRALG